MKKYYKILLTIIIVSAVTFSCEEYLDESPERGISPEEVYTDYFATRGVLDRATRLIHNYVYGQTDWSGPVGTFSDEVQMAKVGQPPHRIYNAGTWLDQGWRELGGVLFRNAGQEFHVHDFQTSPTSKAFLAIRSINLMLENIDQLQEYPTELGYTPQQLKDQLVGQAYYLRAFHYFQIIRRYGGFPILDKVLPTDYNFDEVRPTYLESSNFILEDLDRAIPLLPDAWNAQNKGRGTKSSARALKTMAALYAASPLMNTQLNPHGSESRIYNTEYAETAVQAAVETINGLGTGGYEMLSFSEYTDNWYSRTNPYPREALILPPNSPQSSPNGGGIAGQGWFLPEFMGGWGAEGQPTHNAVDWFETIDGYDIDDPEAITSGSYDPQDPYQNRDPRFHALIFSHGDDMFEQFTNPTGNQKVLDASEGGWFRNFEGGKNKFFAGFYHKGKHRWPGCDRWNRARGFYRMFPHIRVAQVYLDLAEAANEVYGPNGAIPGTSFTAVSAINMVRNRAGMPDVLAKYTTDKETFKERIYNERAVELYHEFHRWFDIRRWKIAKEVLGKGIYRAKITVAGGNTVYEKEPLQGTQRVFEDRHYWYPFPTAVMNLMSVFEQNPGW